MFAFWLTFFKVICCFYISVKSRTSWRVMCKKDNSHFVHYVLISPDVQGLPFGQLFFEKKKKSSVLPFGVFLDVYISRKKFILS